MSVMNVRVVRVPVYERLVPMPVGMRLAHRVIGRVRVLMVLVMDVQVLVLEHLVGVLVFVPLRHVEPHADGHEGCASEEKR